MGDADLTKAEAARRSSMPRRRGLHGRLDGIRATRTGALTLKVVIGVIGTVMVIGGLIMVPFPGPGWLVVFAGLAVLATEFPWASRLLKFAKDNVKAATGWLKRQNWFVRIVASALTLLCAAAIVWGSVRLTLGVDLIQMARRFLG